MSKSTKKATFHNEQGRTIRPNAAEMKAIKACAGYDGEGHYTITTTPRFGTRLFKAVSGRCMDACLRDVPELAKAARRNRI